MDMETKIKFRIDGKKIQNLDDFFGEISRQLFPDIIDWKYHFDGLDDMLGGGFGTPEEGCVLLWDHHQTSRFLLGYEETIRTLEARRERCHPTARRQIDKQIRTARRREGPTIFDNIVEIFERHRPEKNERYSVDLRLL
ncbi:hypothetical protein [Rhizobium sp. BR 315]|uniref:hypothetical protein n=1 Tax=Rhizobium sp. BR 315 TaxID=3040014 RepID=UPI003D32C5C5